MKHIPCLAILFVLPVVAMASSHNADPDLFCGDNSTWERKLRESNDSFASVTANVQAELSFCHLDRLVQDHKNAYKVRVEQWRSVYCGNRRAAEDAYAAVADESVVNAAGQTCQPLQQVQENVRKAKRLQEGLKAEIERQIRENNSQFRDLKRNSERKIGTCSNEIHNRPECVAWYQQPLAQRQTLNNLFNPATANKCQLMEHWHAKLKEDWTKFWKEDAPISERGSAFNAEKIRIEGVLRHVNRLDGQLTQALARLNNCAAPPLAGVAPPGGPGAGAAPATPPAPGASASGLPGANDLANCVRTGCSPEQVKGYQQKINDYIAAKQLPIDPIKVDGIIGTQTANAWRASQMHSQSPFPVDHANAQVRNVSLTQYRQWGGTDSSRSGFVVFPPAKLQSPTELQQYLYMSDQ